jgi:hypothetical protein
LAKRAEHGGQVFVLARKNGVIKLFHVDGLTGIKELVKGGFKHKALLTMETPYDWNALNTALLS